ncbi:hypothetical protein D3C81_1162780 [compost metagenome]
MGIGKRVGHPPLQVTLTGAEGIGQVVKLSRRRLDVQMLQPAVHVTCTTGQDFGSCRQHQHRQRPAHLLQQPRQRLQALTRPTGLQAITDKVFGLLQHIQ